MTFIEWGAFFFGVVIGWNTYFVNRYRGSVKLLDLLSLVGAVGGGAILALFPEQTTLFAAYGIGLFAGFATYFLLLVVFILTQRKKGWTLAYFLDGRRPALGDNQESDATHPMLTERGGVQGGR
ncbi:hypothetical protein [Couchioplanes caeruleus]|uniref:Uncharacterized protein n=2 Tax=Couchioplanes caeruleus TaxID=56438 RepID=A0A1K0FEH7_9ACTN|nr:hypothetical protein [Couchioplanes caeruleus]OJF11144.1 hypothetical protein BG844_27945 [Couchioplanes caeruleus subsp. caeruleus]ROP30915.1 hypothetical protein EDD30_3793 [Couchioplanes caeruleus]